MGKQVRFTDEFKQDAVAQVVERGYAVSEMAERLGISTKSLYTWKAQFAKSSRVRSEMSEQAGMAASQLWLLRTNWNSNSKWLHRIGSG